MLGEIKGRNLFKSVVFFTINGCLLVFSIFFLSLDEWVDNIIVCVYVYIFLKYNFIMKTA